MNNPLKHNRFNQYQATKDRSPRFRIFVIVLLLLTSSIIIYALKEKKNSHPDSPESSVPSTAIGSK